MNRSTEIVPERTVFTVSELNREVRALLEGRFLLTWVSGELSNLARPASGHLYFTLKDEFAQVRCAMFRMRNRQLAFRPENGMQVLIRARVSLYEPRGEFQLVAEHMEEAGDGALRRAFDMLKQRLEAEGLFDPARKRPLPALPRCIGVVTSPTGAAIRDILTVLKRRFPAIPVVIHPVPVQGEGAAARIAAAIGRAGERADCDVLIVGRGGGSLEDLWAFNEEVVARAVAASPLPVVSAVGHEIDFTISDFAADQRAATPSAAAELLSPDRAEWEQRLTHLAGRLQNCTRRILLQREQALRSLQRRLRHPGRRLNDIAQRLDELEGRLLRAMKAHQRHRRVQMAELRARLARHTPAHRLERLKDRQAELERRLRAAWATRLEAQRHRLAETVRTLDAVSPLATLSRGYAIVLREDGSAVRRYDEVTPGEQVNARLHAGTLVCRVEESHADDERTLD